MYWSEQRRLMKTTRVLKMWAWQTDWKWSILFLYIMSPTTIKKKLLKKVKEVMLFLDSYQSLMPTSHSYSPPAFTHHVYKSFFSSYFCDIMTLDLVCSNNRFNLLCHYTKPISQTGNPIHDSNLIVNRPNPVFNVWLSSSGLAAAHVQCLQIFIFSISFCFKSYSLRIFLKKYFLHQMIEVII